MNMTASQLFSVIFWAVFCSISVFAVIVIVGAVVFKLALNL